MAGMWVTPFLNKFEELPFLMNEEQVPCHRTLLPLSP